MGGSQRRCRAVSSRRIHKWGFRRDIKTPWWNLLAAEEVVPGTCCDWGEASLGIGMIFECKDREVPEHSELGIGGTDSRIRGSCVFSPLPSPLSAPLPVPVLIGFHAKRSHSTLLTETNLADPLPTTFGGSTLGPLLEPRLEACSLVQASAGSHSSPEMHSYPG